MANVNAVRAETQLDLSVGNGTWTTVTGMVAAYGFGLESGSKLRPQISKTFRVNACIPWDTVTDPAGDTTLITKRAARIIKNGAYSAELPYQYGYSLLYEADVLECCYGLDGLVSMASGDYIQLQVYQESGGPLNLLAGAYLAISPSNVLLPDQNYFIFPAGASYNVAVISYDKSWNSIGDNWGRPERYNGIILSGLGGLSGHPIIGKEAVYKITANWTIDITQQLAGSSGIRIVRNGSQVLNRRTQTHEVNFAGYQAAMQYPISTEYKLEPNDTINLELWNYKAPPHDGIQPYYSGGISIVEVA